MTATGSRRRAVVATGAVESIERDESPANLEVELDWRDEASRIELLFRWLGRELAAPQVYLVPLRLFIGVGWLRAAIEKISDASWYDGTAVRSFLDQQVGNGAVAFDSYDWLISNIWYPTAVPLGWLVMLIQLVIGCAILVGAYTNGALLVGVLLNINFMLAGAISPSAFYIVIQTTLLATGAGAAFGIDRMWPAGSRHVLLVARREDLSNGRQDRWWLAGLASVFMAVAVFAARSTSNLSASGVEDPALVLAVVMLISSGTVALSLARHLAKTDGLWEDTRG